MKNLTLTQEKVIAGVLEVLGQLLVMGLYFGGPC